MVKRYFINIIVLFFLFSLIFVSTVLGNTGGFHYLKNYTKKDYNHHPQNWEILQDSRGVIYAANQAGLLEFDGVSWRIIFIPNWSVRSLAIDDKGVLYIGGKNEFGYLEADSKGSWKYISLVPQLSNKIDDFSTVWSVHASPEGVYFRTSMYLFRWNSGKMKIWESHQRFKGAFYCHGRLFVQQEDVGLLEMKGDSLQLLPGGKLFSTEKIYMLDEYVSDNNKPDERINSDRLLIGTRNFGFFLYDGKRMIQFPTEADNYLKKNQLYYGIRLSTGDYAFATLLGGLIIMNNLGQIQYIYTSSAGLQDDDIKHIYQDREGNLWLALNKGISRIEYMSPFLIFDQRQNLKGIVLSMEKFNGCLYVGTTNGMYFQENDSLFQRIPGISGMCWDLVSLDTVLLAATDNGIFELANTKSPLKKIFAEQTFVMKISRVFKNCIWVGSPSGISSLRWKKEKTSSSLNWTIDSILKQPGLSIRTIVEDEKGTVWLGTLTNGVLNINFPSRNELLHPVVVPYDTKNGLPQKEINVFWIAKHVMFTSDKGIYRFRYKQKDFIPDLTLGSEYVDGSRNIFRIAEDSKNRIWFHSRGKNGVALPVSTSEYHLNYVPFLRIPVAQVNIIFPEREGETVWFGSVDGLVKYNISQKTYSKIDYGVLIRRITINSNILSFDGNITHGNDRVNKKLPEFNYTERNFRFLFASPFFEEETASQYRFKLAGYDEDWSQWTIESQKDYTNLNSGEYCFYVQAKNIFDQMSSEDVYAFKIRFPWYKQWWALTFYGVSVFFLFYFIVHWRSRYLYKEKLRLERVVQDRTRDIDSKHRQLEKQSAQLKELAEVKNRFFTNISHEFRTPLTLIMGPLEELRSRLGNTELVAVVDSMMRNSHRLLSLINQLLDLSKIESGKLKLHSSQQNIVPFLKEIIDAFRLTANKHQLELQLITELEEINLFFDTDKMEKVLYNLLSNALKFTPPPGNVIVKVLLNSDSNEMFPLGSLEIIVSDTGIGIPESQLAFIFDRFYQANSAQLKDNERNRLGSGIGLALARELVELHHGRLDVQSTQGENRGTRFIIRLPLGGDHLAPDQIFESYDYLISEPGNSKDIATYNDFLGNEVLEQTEDLPENIEASERITILIVEDNLDLREYIKRSLGNDFVVIEAGDGESGIEIAKKLIPDFIISDIMMPGVDGYELCNQLKKKVTTSHIPIILLTAKTSEESIIQGLESGADDYVTKPFNPRILRARISNLIELRRQLQLNRRRKMTLEPDIISVSSVDDDFLKELQKIIETYLSKPEFNVEQMCKKMYMGRTTLYKKVLALTGETPSQFIRSYRLKRAAQLLSANAGNVTEIAFQVGFTSTSYFSKCFKEQFHRLPSDY